MDSNTIGGKYGNKKLMNTKVPLAKKYAHIKPTFKTGKTVKDVEILSSILQQVTKS